MVPENAKQILLLALGIGLLLNPVYLYPDDLTGSKPAVTYEVEPVENETVAERVVHRTDRTLKCGTERACALEREVAAEGSIEYEGSVQRTDRPVNPYQRAWNRYALIAIDDGFHVPEERHEENATILTHREVSTMEALEHVAVPSDRVSTEVHEVTEEGEITVVDRRIPELEAGDPIEHDGTVYHVTRRVYESGRSEIMLLRLLLWTFGAVSVGIAWRRRGR